ncbi:MAG TPA: hypothetical protein VFK04_12965 [Gemmatimonadaceae bacterium]|nr:hypothetical protein [Gemmatimonadaceae bacterium]
MASRRDQILAAVVAILNGAGKPADTTVERYRTLPLTTEGAWILVYPMIEATERAPTPSGRLARRKLRVRCECRAQGEQVDQVLDPLLLWTVKALMADPSLGGVAINVQEEATQWDAEDADKVYGAAAVDFTIDYQTAAADPSAAS